MMNYAASGQRLLPLVCPPRYRPADGTLID